MRAAHLQSPRVNEKKMLKFHVFVLKIVILGYVV